MSLANKCKISLRLGKMALSVALNSGVMPKNHLSMVLIEPTSICNLSCPLCPTGTGTLKRDNKFIEMDVFDRIVELTKPHAKGFILNMFGEPLFHPHFKDMAQKTKPLPTWLSTNLNYASDIVLMLNEFSHLNVICSIDTLNPEEYPKYRVGGDYEKVMKNLAILAKGKCSVYPQFLVSETEYDAEKIDAFAREFGIPSENLIIKKKLEHYRLDPTDKPSEGVCHFPYTGIYFTCDGYLVPCCNNVREDLYIKHVSELSDMEEILSGKSVKRVRKQLAKDKNTFESCGRCEGHDFWEQEFLPHLQVIKRVFSSEKDKRKHQLK